MGRLIHQLLPDLVEFLTGHLGSLSLPRAPLHQQGREIVGQSQYIGSQVLGRFRCNLVLHSYRSIDGIPILLFSLRVQGLAILKEELRNFIGGAGDLVLEGLREDSGLDHGVLIRAPFEVICVSWHSYPYRRGLRGAA